MSKLYKLMEVIRFAMQSAIRSLVLDSLLAFVQFVSDACLETMDCPDDLTWNSDFINSPYKPKTCPIFIVDLVLEPTGVRYSTPIENFETKVHSLFNNAILASHKIPHVEKFIMKNLFITGTPLLESVGLHEQEVEELRSTLRKSLGQAIIPLRAYAAHYQTFMPLLNLNIEQFAKWVLTINQSIIIITSTLVFCTLFSLF
uniref:Uncharacterized protein n=1 Tax=Eptatretus burgeri TaxID=7764 RepID=A0A8C4NHF4_EPTBU